MCCPDNQEGAGRLLVGGYPRRTPGKKDVAGTLDSSLQREFYFCVIKSKLGCTLAAKHVDALNWTSKCLCTQVIVKEWKCEEKR